MSLCRTNEHKSREPLSTPSVLSDQPYSDGWDHDYAANELWNREGIRMPPPKCAHNVPRNSLTTIVEHIGKDLEQFASRRIGGEPKEEPLQLVFEDLPYTPYGTSRQSPSTTSTIYFRVCGRSSDALDMSGIDAFPLAKALRKDFGTLCDRQMSAPLGNVSTKLSIRIHFLDCELYSRQIMARRSTSSSDPVSMEVLAHKIAKEVKDCLTKTSEASRPLIHRGREVQLDDLYLWRLKRVSSGSWVPEFKVATWI